MIEQLFGSKTRVKLLQLFLNNPNRAFYVREITRKIDEQINSVRRELANMLSIGIITSESQNNRLYYEINQKYEHYKALKAIFTAKSVKASIKEEEDDLTKQIRELGSVKLVLFSGAFTRDTFAPVDVLIVGDVNKTKVKKFITKLEQDEGRELRYTTLDMDDYDYRIAVKDRFITDVLNAKKTVILDDDNRIKKSK